MSHELQHQLRPRIILPNILLFNLFESSNWYSFTLLYFPDSDSVIHPFLSLLMRPNQFIIEENALKCSFASFNFSLSIIQYKNPLGIKQTSSVTKFHRALQFSQAWKQPAYNIQTKSPKWLKAWEFYRSSASWAAYCSPRKQEYIRKRLVRKTRRRWIRDPRSAEPSHATGIGNREKPKQRREKRKRKRWDWATKRERGWERERDVIVDRIRMNWETEELWREAIFVIWAFFEGKIPMGRVIRSLLTLSTKTNG